MSEDSQKIVQDNNVYSQNTREADKLPLESLVSYLRVELPEFIQSNRLHVEQFSAGSSNLTYHLSNGTDSIILRRPPTGTKAKSAHDMIREYNVLKQVGKFYSLSPRPIIVCEDVNIIGEQFFLMQKISGLGIDKNLPVSMDEATQTLLCENFVRGLVELHEIDITTSDISQLGKPEGYVERQLEGWHNRFSKAKTEDVPSSHFIYSWLTEHLPTASGYASLIHNDFKFDNLILDSNQPENIIGVLDWEMATLGDPLLDLGCSLAYWIEADDPPSLQAIRMMPTHLPGMMTRDMIFSRYCELRDIQDIALKPYYVFGIFRLAVIAQQIYFRFYHGQTDNPKFKNFGQLVGILIERCATEINQPN